MDTTPEGMNKLTAACAVEEACVVLDVGTSLEDSLAALDEAEQSVAMVLSDDGAIIGVLTRASIMRAMDLFSDTESDAESSASLDSQQ